MKLIVVQLSDIHLSVERWPINPILDRVTKIESAIKSLFLDGISQCLLLVTGDIAYAGLPSEYELAMKLLAGVRTVLENEFGKDNCHSILLPGNHDCDFKQDNAARKSLIESVHPDAFDDGSILDVCTRPQDEFFTFCAQFQNQAASPAGIQRVIDTHKFAAGTEAITVRVLNSAWGSKIHEGLGTLLMPVKPLRPVLLADSEGSLVITAFHHPYSWFEKGMGKDIRVVVEETSDLVFTGHEHERQSYAKTKFSGEHNEYIEAGPLQENGTPGQSEFNVVIVDTERQEYAVHHFAWAESFYELVNEGGARPFIRNNSRLRNEFALNARFEKELNDADSDYHHPFKDAVTLEDVFIYPDLREFSLETTSHGSGQNASKQSSERAPRWDSSRKSGDEGQQFFRKTIKSREVVNYILTKKAVVVSAPERAGKTAFARVLCKDLWRNGKIPLLMSGEEFDAKPGSDISKYLERIFSQQYRSPRVSRYWDIDISQRAIIIDDFHKLPNIRAIRDKLLAEIQKRFSIIVVLGGSPLRFQELVSSASDANLLSDFVHAEFLSFGAKLRSQLIRRWFELGRQERLPDDQIAQQVSIIERIVGIILGRDLLPRFPSYILLVLQAMELRQPVDIAAASYGSLYRASMTSSLAKKGFDVETALSYLSELAYAFFGKKVDCFDDQQAIDWHNRYVNDYKITMDLDPSRDLLVKAGLLSYQNGLIRFKVKAAFYFFLANYLSNHKTEPSCQEDIRTLAGKIYREDAANVILFLCHLDPAPFVIDEMLANATKLFRDVKESDLVEDVRFTGDLVARLHQPVIEHGEPEKRRQQMLEAQDALIQDDDPSDEMYHYRREEETDLESESRRQLAQINAAMKTIQIQGQIVLSFAGSLKGDRKLQLVESCYSLSLRLLHFVFDAFKLTQEEFGKRIAERIAEKQPNLLPERVNGLANALIFMLVEMCTLGVIRHLAGSVGSERLAPTLKEVVARDGRFAVRTLDGAIHLEHFVSIPERLLVDLFEQSEGNLLMQSVIKNLAFDRLSYFQCPHEVRQRLCKKLGIKMLAATALDPERKRD